MKKKFVIVIAILVVAVMAVLCWARTPILSGLPEGQWTVRSSAVVYPFWYEMPEIPSGEELKQTLEGVNAWRDVIGYRSKIVVPIYVFFIEADGREWMLSVCIDGYITTKAVDYNESEHGFWRTEGGPVTPEGLASEGRKRVFRDDGSLYRLLVERFGDAGLGTLEESRETN